MKKLEYQMLKIALLLFAVILISSCAKNVNSEKGDAKIRFVNGVYDSRSQDFYINGILNLGFGAQSQNTSNIAYNSQTAYIIVDAYSKYKFELKNYRTNFIHTTGELEPKVGENYTVVYTRSANTKDSLLYIYKEDLKIDTSQSKLVFVNLGYTLKSKVSISDSLGTFNKTIGYGEKSDYFYVKFNGKNKVNLNLVDSTGVVTTYEGKNFLKGRNYTFFIDGTKTGKLTSRFIENN
jgi:hypothetical protein